MYYTFFVVLPYALAIFRNFFVHLLITFLQTHEKCRVFRMKKKLNVILSSPFVTIIIILIVQLLHESWFFLPEKEE